MESDSDEEENKEAEGDTSTSERITNNTVQNKAPGTIAALVAQRLAHTSATDRQVEVTQLVNDWHTLITDDDEEFRPAEEIHRAVSVPDLPLFAFLMVNEDHQVRVVHSFGDVTTKDCHNKWNNAFIAFTCHAMEPTLPPMNPSMPLPPDASLPAKRHKVHCNERSRCPPNFVRAHFLLHH